MQALTLLASESMISPNFAKCPSRQHQQQLCQLTRFGHRHCVYVLENQEGLNQRSSALLQVDTSFDNGAARTEAFNLSEIKNFSCAKMNLSASSPRLPMAKNLKHQGEPKAQRLLFQSLETNREHIKGITSDVNAEGEATTDVCFSRSKSEPSNPTKMMRLKTYAGLSLIATLAITYHAFSSREQFYPAMVYLSTSKISLVLLLNMGLVVMCSLWQLTKKVFLGSLREAEVERLNEQSWREVMEILFAITIFRQDFSVTFLAMVTALLLIKALHWLAQKRVEYIETTPAVPMLSHIRIVSFMGFLLLLDSLFLYSSMKHLIDTWQASVSLFFAFEYMILATTTVSIFVKYLFYVSDMLMEGQWERKPVFTFYLELIRDLLHLSMYLCFFLVIFVNYGIPLHLIRELYETFRNFKVRVADYIRYRKITSNMNDRFPDATPEELNASDATCIICREEMTTAKKLICGHLFHVHCLRSWLERQHTCPTCRALVVPPENGTTAVGQQGSQSDSHQQGTGNASQTEVGNAVGTDSLNRHQARLQAAAAAASIYEKSYVYPSASSFVRSPGNTLYPPVQISLPESQNSDHNGEEASSEQTQRQFLIPGAPTNVSFPPIQHFQFLPSQIYATPLNYGEGFGNDPNVPSSQLEAQRKLLQCQIQILQNQLEILQRTKTDKSVDDGPSSSDSRGKQMTSSAETGQANAEEIQDGKA
ncbi:hypothetical protein VNO77_41498 [Canavalia gladiata]|uniref:RING-type E3 ubiquitin transferase n=1 Tax=Canavalia gladiata TaxID=3824 RepID=A0AAN9K1R8_CANGL